MVFCVGIMSAMKPKFATAATRILRINEKTPDLFGPGVQNQLAK
ncbi:hypothetical protein thalar_01935 [Litoreibacter arenae DSM 19593]|uniref:Uncharacterized protein n=1 Tax=Litoreibacter arenae DSM 19593 TaxID=1123360 RepID=S9QCI8_9RHOB|nr:hypothetical protein thalar_01935 [Litoreibacter arenae DSM 19593]